MKLINNNFINIRGTLRRFDKPKIMAVLNTTPDSFYAQSRRENEQAIATAITQFIEQGADIIDVGGYSSRPGAEHISIEQEKERLKPALEYLAINFPNFPVSIDTFRAEVAYWAIKDYSVGIINDISGGQLDSDIIPVAAQLQCPFIGMHMRGTPQTMQENTKYNDIVREIIMYFAQMIEKCKLAGINDIIVDPGFGFSKTIEQNYEILNNLQDFLVLDRPILAGMSRKSMIYKLLDIKPSESLPGTISLHTIALLKGASIIRVHDVKEAVQMLYVTQKVLNLNP